MTRLFDEAGGVWLLLLQEPYALRSQVISGWKPRIGSNPVLRLED